MSVYAVNRIQQIVSCIHSNAVAPLVEYSELTEQVLQWLGDTPSKEAYNRELAFMVLRKLVGDELAVKYTGNVSMEAWAEALRMGKEAWETGRIPQYTLSVPEDKYPGEYGMTATFIMEQYAYGEQVRVRGGDIFLDCGACYGDTALWALRSGAQHVYAFEPGSASFRLLQENVRRHAPEGGVTCENVAVGDTEGTARFNYLENSPTGSVLSAQGGMEVPMTRIDTYCNAHGIIPNFIKMDLEGGEPLALLGAQVTIRTHAPRLAICLYHDLSHMWELPRFIKSLRPDYSFWCRKNNPWHEFVLYAAVR